MDPRVAQAWPWFPPNSKRAEALLQLRSLPSNHRQDTSSHRGNTVASQVPESQAQHQVRKLIPGERVQMDTCKIAPGVYQYTAIDDCTRIRVLAIYSRRSAANSLLFLERAIEEFPFPIQAIQSDRGTEFFAYSFQERLMKYAIKFRPVRPASPHLNGQVERSQRTDLDEFYCTANLKSPDLSQRLEEWQDHYNQYRIHGSLNGRTPWEAWGERLRITPFSDEVEAAYDPAAERIRHPHYQTDLLFATQSRTANRL